MNDEQIGYLTAKVEEMGSVLIKMDERLDALEKNVAEKFTTVEAAFKVLKFVGLAVGAILTLKWGQLPDLWNLFFGN